MSVVGFLYPPSDSLSIRVGCKARGSQKGGLIYNVSGILFMIQYYYNIFLKKYKKNSQEFLGVFFGQIVTLIT